MNDFLACCGVTLPSRHAICLGNFNICYYQKPAAFELDSYGKEKKKKTQVARVSVRIILFICIINMISAYQHTNTIPQFNHKIEISYKIAIMVGTPAGN